MTPLSTHQWELQGSLGSWFHFTLYMGIAEFLVWMAATALAVVDVLFGGTAEGHE
ncbi:hypothetical protein D3C71_1965770 [compost metagenome]